jgi:glycosyltransferase involved in cell wall biosynthesis
MLPNFLAERYFTELDKDNRDIEFRGKCLFLGQIKREKGIFTIIQGLSGLHGYSCDFYGPVVARDREEFMEKVGPIPNLEYRGIASPEEVPDILKSYDALLLPTSHSGEGYPAVILQAFACRTAVIASRWISIPDLIGDDEMGVLIPVGDQDALVEALDRLSGDREFRDRVRGNALEYAIKYSERRIIGEMLISDILGGSQHLSR